LASVKAGLYINILKVICVEINLKNGYLEVNTPQILDRKLWEKSGHWDKFGDMIFTTHSEKKDYAIKPMKLSCSCSNI
jgi:threonyl-tRNA synthetase